MLTPVGRREFLALTAGLIHVDIAQQWRLGVMDGVLRLPGSPQSPVEAARLGFQGLQVTIPRPVGSSPSSAMEDPSRIKEIREAARIYGVAINATYLEVLHVHCLKNDPEARAWVRRGIEITRALGAPILMTVFFGKCAIQGSTERDTVAAAFRELVPVARESGVVIGFENLLSAEESARVVDEIGREWLQVYYDVGNATNLVGTDPAREIRFLGKNRICQLHFKDKGYLGEGKVDFPEVLSSLNDIDYRGWANLGTSAPSGDFAADLDRNIQYLHRIAGGNRL